MEIIIVGAGKVGFHLAKTLSIGHNVTVIDKNNKALKRIQESTDILTIQGDVENVKIYENLISKNIDFFVSVTNIDNVNIVSVMIAETILNIKRKFIRLHNHYYDEKMLKESLGIEKIIFPRKLASQTILSLLDYPKANNIKKFNYTEHKLISIKVSTHKQKIAFNLDKVVIVGIERDKNFFIPQEKDINEIELFARDLVYFFGFDYDIIPLFSELDTTDTDEIERCVVFGGDDLGISISKALIKENKNVKLIESNYESCKKADEILEGKADVINLKYGTETIYEDENLTHADMFIASTNNDEYNIIKCLEARDKGINKIVAINNELEYYNLMHSLGIIVTRGPKISAYNTIMENINSTKVVIQKSFCGAKAVVYMRKIFSNSKLINKMIKPPKNILKSKIYYIHNNQLHFFDSNIILDEDDLIIVFAISKESSKIQDWIYGL